MVLALPLGCGGSQPAPAAPEGAADGKQAGADDENVPVPEKWSDDMPEKQKVAFMKAKVVPRMAPIFQAFDAKEFARFDCTTCHGPNMKEPHDFLPAVEIKDGKFVEQDEHPELIKFMQEKVVPEMASIFGMPVYDPATKQGFGCARCHEMKM
jgi:hypothetical protein